MVVTGRLVVVVLVVVVTRLLLLLLLAASWLMIDAMPLPFFKSGQQTPGTKRLWKQIDFRKLSSWSNKAGQLDKSRHEPLPPSGVVHGRLPGDDELGGSVLLGKAMSTLFPELIFSAVEEPSDWVAKGRRLLSVNLPSWRRALPIPRPSRCSAGRLSLETVQDDEYADGWCFSRNYNLTNLSINN